MQNYYSIDFLNDAGNWIELRRWPYNGEWYHDAKEMAFKDFQSWIDHYRRHGDTRKLAVHLHKIAQVWDSKE